MRVYADNAATTYISETAMNTLVDCLKNYSGEVLLVGVNYDKEKRHTCRIERAVI